MFSRLFKNFMNKPASEEAVEQVRRRYRSPFKARNTIPKQTQQEQQAWFAKSAAAPAAAPQPTATNQPTNRSKYIRYAFIALGTGYFAMRVFGRDPLGRTLSNPSSAGPKFVLSIEKLDDKIANYRSTYYAASQGIRKAFTQQARNLMLQRLGLQFDDLTDEQISDLQLIGKVYNEGLKNISPLIDDGMKGLQDLALIVGDTDEIKAKKLEIQEKYSKTLAIAMEKKITLEFNLLNEIGNVLAKQPKSLAILQNDTTLTSRIKNNLLGLQNGGKNEFLMEKVSQISSLPVYEKGKVFVLQFKGDVMASGVAKLREEITAVLSVADPKRGDRVIVQLNSPGGTVTGYGLGAAQIIRLKDAGLPVTVSVDEVAASGGYMMACVADRIVASPFAVIGSIGVVQTMPNFSEFLERHGVSVEDVTAGKFKRTMTPYKKNTEEDRKKVKSDLEAVFALFRNFIKNNRPKLNVDDVATGEIWHGPDALKKGLIDELRTTDDLILQARDAGFDVYKFTVRPAAMGPFGDPSDGPVGALMSDSSSISEKLVAWVSWMVRQVVMDVMRKEVLPPLGGSWESGEYDWRAQRDLEETSSHDIRKMILAIDPSLTQNPPKL